MIVALLLYCWSHGTRSSRRIERACCEDVAGRVIVANERPDHATIARFVERHQTALAGLFGEVLQLCADAGLATVGVIAVDGTKIAANASRDRSVTYEQLAKTIVEEAVATDEAETARFGDAAVAAAGEDGRFAEVSCDKTEGPSDDGPSAVLLPPAGASLRPSSRPGRSPCPSSARS